MHHRLRILLIGIIPLLALLSTPGLSTAAKLVPVDEFVARDMPYDEGEKVLLVWKAMTYDGKDVKNIAYISKDGASGPWKEAASIASDTGYKADIDLPFWSWRKTKDYHAVNVQPLKVFPIKEDEDNPIAKKARAEEENRIKGATYHFKVASVRGKDKAESPIVSAAAKGNWFSVPRLNNLIYTFFFCGIILWFISHARKKDLFIRRIPGLDAVDEAIGRATEMGRPIYFLTGRKDIDEIPTIAAALILGEIAKKVAEYDTVLKVPHTYAMTYSMCQEITKQAYSQAGRPDSYRDDCNFFITDDQFAYTAAVNGMMVREKPAACFYMGYYYAESLLLAEVGSSVGAIQIAGTDAEHQLPFFFITCDYTLIGEELYAAGAYLSREPVLVGTLRGQDVGKAFTIIVVFLGVLLSSLSVLFGFETAAQIILEPFKSF
ncbi:DUF6754 domain-containing protein [Elusimicrobiota bacterium]